MSRCRSATTTLQFGETGAFCSATVTLQFGKMGAFRSQESVGFFFPCPSYGRMRASSDSPRKSGRFLATDKLGCRGIDSAGLGIQPMTRSIDVVNRPSVADNLCPTSNDGDKIANGSDIIAMERVMIANGGVFMPAAHNAPVADQFIAYAKEANVLIVAQVLGHAMRIRGEKK